MFYLQTKGSRVPHDGLQGAADVLQENKSKDVMLCLYFQGASTDKYVLHLVRQVMILRANGNLARADKRDP